MTASAATCIHYYLSIRRQMHRSHCTGRPKLKGRKLRVGRGTGDATYLELQDVYDPLVSCLNRVKIPKTSRVSRINFELETPSTCNCPCPSVFVCVFQCKSLFICTLEHLLWMFQLPRFPQAHTLHSPTRRIARFILVV